MWLSTLCFGLVPYYVDIVRHATHQHIRRREPYLAKPHLYYSHPVAVTAPLYTYVQYYYFGNGRSHQHIPLPNLDCSQVVDDYREQLHRQ